MLNYNLSNPKIISKKFFILLISLILFSCSKKTEKIKWDYSTSDILTPKLSANVSDSIEIYIFIDATSSMKGFANVPNSIYNSFLDDFEANSQTSWKNVQLKYFKFGTKIKEITRDQFRQAKTQKFYEEPGIFEKTNIDLVIDFIGKNYKQNHIYVIISDFFQNESDINLLNLKIKQNCFTKNISVGILGLKSEFDGLVYDAKVPPFYYRSKIGDINSYRNLIVLAFGNESNILNMIDKLKLPYVNKNYFLLIPYKLVSEFSTDVSKPKTKIKLSVKSSNKELNLFNFNLRDKSKSLDLNVTLNIQTIPYLPKINYDKINVQCYYKYQTKNNLSKDSIPYNEVYLKQISAENNTIKATLSINIPEENGIYSFLIYFQPSQTDGLIPSDWVYEFSSDNPNPLKDQNKTLNFDKFVLNLIKSAMVSFDYKIAKLYINIKKEA
jgi:hypothetical protein